MPLSWEAWHAMPTSVPFPWWGQIHRLWCAMVDFLCNLLRRKRWHNCTACRLRLWCAWVRLCLSLLFALGLNHNCTACRLRLWCTWCTWVRLCLSLLFALGLNLTQRLRPHPHPQGHEDFTAEVDNIRSYGIKGPIHHRSVESEPIGSIMGLQTNDSLVHATDLITKTNSAPHPIVVNMAGGL